MTLKEHIDNIRKRLEQNIFKSETAVRQGIVDPLLRSLGWPTDDTMVVFPEYSVEGGRVDYALCHPPSKPRVFIEAKQVGNIKGAEEQLLRYAFQRGVPIAVLTDGREWQFFYPMGEGTWAERKVCELDIITGDSRENAETLNRYLNYESIRTGEAIEAIKADYEKIVQQRQVATRLPEAWSKLLEEADEFLLHAVAEKTESLCGYRPTDAQVLNFLKNLKKETGFDRTEAPPPLVSSVQPATHRRTIGKQKAQQTRLVVTMPNGERIAHLKAIDTFSEVILKLIEMRGDEQVISADKEDMVISTSPIGRHPYRLDRYYIAKDYSTKDKKRLLDRMTDRLGVQVKIEIVDK